MTQNKGKKFISNLLRMWETRVQNRMCNKYCWVRTARAIR